MDLISVALRFEVGIAFAFFPLPVSLFVGIAFSIINELAVKYYRSKSSLAKKASVLVLFALLNTIVFAIGAFFSGNFIMHKGTERALISYENIKYCIFAVLYFALAIVLWRMLILGIPLLFKRNTEAKEDSPCRR